MGQRIASAGLGDLEQSDVQSRSIGQMRLIGAMLNAYVGHAFVRELEKEVGGVPYRRWLEENTANFERLAKHESLFTTTRGERK